MELDEEAFKAAVIAGYAPPKDRREDIIRAAIVAYEAAKPRDPLRYAAPELLEAALLLESALLSATLYDGYDEKISKAFFAFDEAFAKATAEGTT